MVKPLCNALISNSRTNYSLPQNVAEKEDDGWAYGKACCKAKYGKQAKEIRQQGSIYIADVKSTLHNITINMPLHWQVMNMDIC